MIYILSKTNKPLMPTNRHGKIRHLLKEGKAKVVKRCPFTIKLLYDSTEYVQDLNLGIDTGSSTIGTAVVDTKGNVAYMSKATIRNDIADKMSRRASYRRTRRNRKTRYRKARWLNRKNSTKSNRFSPTMKSKINSHIREIEYIHSILPISKLIIETGTFDTHLMKNPSLGIKSISHWGYQKGSNYDLENTKAKVLFRDNHNCQHCKSKKGKMEVHHIIFRRNGGSDDEENLITLCSKCHYDLHHGKITLKNTGKRKTNLKYATQMNSIRLQLLNFYSNAEETFGYVTKTNRYTLGLEKDHHIDACVIASGGKSINLNNSNLYLKKHVSKGDYQLFKGIRSEQKIPSNKIHGFNKFDKVNYFGKDYFIKGRMSTGFAILMDIEGNKIDFGFMLKGFKTPKLRNCKRISARGTTLCTKQRIILNTT